MRVRFVLIGVVSFGLLGASVSPMAQAIAARPVPPTVVFGENVGFRIEGERGGTPVGRIVVKQDGKWVVAELGAVPSVRGISHN